MEKTITFLHSGEMGDIIASMCTIKEICDRDGVKAKIAIDTTGGLKANPENILRAIKIQTFGNGMRMGDHGYDFLRPLLIKQPYVSDVIKWKDGMNIDINLNSFRLVFLDNNLKKITNQNLVFMHQISNALNFGYKGPWLIAPTNRDREGIVVARSTRYQASHTIYDSLRQNIISQGRFLGTEFEAKVFENAFGYFPKLAHVNNALDAAIEINASKMVVANSTVFYWIAVGLGHPNILHEMSMDLPCSFFPNQNPPIKYIDGNRFFK